MVGLLLVLSLCWLVWRGGFSAGVLVVAVGRVGLFVCGLLLVFWLVWLFLRSSSGVLIVGVSVFLLFVFLCFVAVFLSWFLWFVGFSVCGCGWFW